MRIIPRWPAAILRRLPARARRLPALVRRFLHWYGTGPLHLLTMAGCFALAGWVTPASWARSRSRMPLQA